MKLYSFHNFSLRSNFSLEILIKYILIKKKECTPVQPHTPKPFNILFCCCFFLHSQTLHFPHSFISMLLRTPLFALDPHSPPSRLGSLRTVISFNIFRERTSGVTLESRYLGKRVRCKKEPVLYQVSFSSLQSRRIL